MKKNKLILEMSCSEAKDFLLKNESYSNIQLPSYFSFSGLLSNLNKEIGRKNLGSLFKEDIKEAKKKEDVNYTLYGNKDGRLSYRPLQLIHPLIYVAMVKDITKRENWKKIQERFKENFQTNPKIECHSIPVESQTKNEDKGEQILNWWSGIEQASIDLSMEYTYMYETDIADCYSSIYTHSIAWAIETKEIAKETAKETAKEKRSLNLLGNSIDNWIQSMQYGQTNGIPQGSVLMDFIAEIVLGYIDKLLTEEIDKYEIEDYKILRYRDDYRIFVNNPQDGQNILKLLSKILVPFGLKLNTSKTKENIDIITHSIKKDKLEWFKLVGNQEGLKSKQKQMLVIYQHSLEYPNSGSLVKALGDFVKNLKDENSTQIISIAVNIMLNNPKTISQCSLIISKILKNIEEEQKKNILDKIYKRIKNAVNSEIAKIWLQRIVKSNVSEYEFEEKLCEIVKGEKNIKLWNNDWINEKNNKFKELIEENSIFDQEKFESLDEVIQEDEVKIFYPNYH